MLTSKDIIERTGISRATLNNYIASGLVAKPQVLPPGPEDGAAPRIGYFPDDTIARIEVIQRLKREGWSIARIAQQFANLAGAQAGSAVPAVASRAGATIAAMPATPPAIALSLQDAGQPAYLVDNRFRLAWQNAGARRAAWWPGTAAAIGGNVFQHLLAVAGPERRDALLRFHLEVAQERAVPAGDLAAGLGADDARRLESILREMRPEGRAPVGHVALPAGDGQPDLLLYAVHFHEGVLFAAAAPGPADAAAAITASRGTAPRAPAITPVAVLYATLQDAAGLWVKLPAQDYFELVNEVWAALEPVFRRHHGLPGRHPDEGLVCYFLPQRGASHLWHALAAAAQAREAMMQLSRRWRQRQGWDADLAMTIGLDEGQEWLGSTGPEGRQELRVLGEAAERAEQLSRCGRPGAILVTRSLLGKLAPDEGRRIRYGVPRSRSDGGAEPLPQAFARLGDLAAPLPVPARMADLAVAELLDLSPAAPTGSAA